jgi:ABC-type transporter Mla maintaining outer membrane lipid asymmetry permease subunit MlaE
MLIRTRFWSVSVSMPLLAVIFALLLVIAAFLAQRHGLRL